MNILEVALKDYTTGSIAILDSQIPLSKYCLIDLSSSNKDLERFDVTVPQSCQEYIDEVLSRHNAMVAFGGYLEHRSLYTKSERFIATGVRNIHLGMDFWCKAGTEVIAPLDGKVVCFKNNDDIGNYGPTIILEHELQEVTFYTLYGHLSLESIEGLLIGDTFKAGQVLATLGTPDINVNYAPHLHFQIISDLEGSNGDYPGVCSREDLVFYQKNCPNPNLLLKLSF
nr:peptidoglycan DD-metalloendopeptidase family protein [uncultured Allomuricauda sp.]